MDKIDKAIDRLQMGAQISLQTYGKPLVVCYSGGKDSQVLVDLVSKANIDCVVRHNVTTVDAPETIRTVRKTFARLEEQGIKCEMAHPEITMWKLIEKKRTPPTRLMRYCCAYFKERDSRGSFIATGVRQGESNARKKRDVVDVITRKKEERDHFDDEVFLSNDNSENRRIIERCIPKNAMCVNPIIDWSDSEVVDYYWNECEIQNPLYLEEFKRIGCIGCPMTRRGLRMREFGRYPQFMRAYIRAFGKMLEARKAAGLKTDERWSDGQAVFDWWCEDKNVPGQMRLDL